MSLGLLVASENANTHTDRQDSCFISIDYIAKYGSGGLWLSYPLVCQPPAYFGPPVMRFSFVSEEYLTVTRCSALCCLADPSWLRKG